VTGKSDHIANGNSVHCEHWNRLPDSVLYDSRLSLACRCVYAVLAGTVYQGTVAKMGQRRISKLLGIHQETVALALRDLAARGHITISGNGNYRRTYHLHSDVFGQKQRAGIEEVIGSPSGGRRFASVRRA
jgi:hypothetical protein